MTQIKFCRLDRLYEAHRQSINAIVERVYSKGQVLGGESVRRLEERVAIMCDRKYAVAVGSCTDALSLSLLASEVKAKDYVAVNDFTFKASKSCISRVGAYRILCPREDDYYGMDIKTLKERVRNFKPKAIIAVNLFGQMANMEEIIDIARANKCIVIEDAAQSFTSGYDGKPAGSWGDVSCISFDPTKIIPAFATGGMVLTDDEKARDSVKYTHYKNYGSNSQMSTLQAEILLYWLGFVEEWEKRRAEIAEKYIKEFSGIKGIILPKTYLLSKHVWHKFVIRAEKRDGLKYYLHEEGIETKIHYEPNKEVLSLPIYPTLQDEEVEWIIEKIKRYY